MGWIRILTVDWRCFSPWLGIDYNWGSGEQDNGNPVKIVANGTIEKVIHWDGVTKGFGEHIFVKHVLEHDIDIDQFHAKKGEIIYSHYCHLKVITAQEGQELSAGTQIAECGGTGGWPSHLHLEIRKQLGLGYEFWPKGYNSDWIAQNYADPYGLIEKYKGDNMATMQVETQLYGKLVHNSSLADDTVNYLGLAEKADDVSFDTVKNSLEAREGKLTTCKKDLATRDSQLAAANQEVLNREEQVSRLKDEATEREKLYNAEITALKASMPNNDKLLETYKAKVDQLTSDLKEEAKAKGTALNELAETKAKLESALAGQYNELTIWQWFSLLSKVKVKG